MGTFPGPQNAGGGVPGLCEVLRGVQLEIGYTSSGLASVQRGPRDSDDVRTGRFTERTGDGLGSPGRRLAQSGNSWKRCKVVKSFSWPLCSQVLFVKKK